MPRVAAIGSLTMAALLLFTGAVSAKQDKVYVCHAAGQAGTTHFVTLYVPANEGGFPQGHFTESGTQSAGHEEDYLGPCESSSPSPSASPSAQPSATPTSEPTASPTSTPSSSPSPEPTRNPDPSATPTPSSSPSSSASTPPSRPTPDTRVMPPTDAASETGSTEGADTLGVFIVIIVAAAGGAVLGLTDARRNPR